MERVGTRFPEFRGTLNGKSPNTAELAFTNALKQLNQGSSILRATPRYGRDLWATLAHCPFRARNRFSCSMYRSRPCGSGRPRPAQRLKRTHETTLIGDSKPHSDDGWAGSGVLPTVEPVFAALLRTNEYDQVSVVNDRPLVAAYGMDMVHCSTPDSPQKVNSAGINEQLSNQLH